MKLEFESKQSRFLTKSLHSQPRGYTASWIETLKQNTLYGLLYILISYSG